MGETLARLIDRTALRMKEKDAFLFLRRGKPESKISYTSLQKVSHRVAKGLIEMGLQRGDRVLLFMPKSIEQVVFHLGIQKAGAISVILNPGFKREEMEYFIQDTDPRLLIVGRKEEPLIRTIDEKRVLFSIETESPFFEEKLFPKISPELSLPEGNPDDAAVLIYTSGTTGHPKGAILTQENLIQDAMNIIQTWEVSEQDIL
jgi:malonyl-CoA/methylmalonyl-CoA synthetase